MITAPARLFVALMPFGVLACSTDSRDVPTTVALADQRASWRWSEWTNPVNIGPPVNSVANDQAPTLSRDALALYFSSDRAGGHGGFDIWVSRRSSRDDAWGIPENLGPLINTALNEGGPDLSPNGHVLFFQRNPALGGQADIYASHRTHTHDDFAWSAAVLLNSHVNTDQFEVGPFYVVDGNEDGLEDAPAKLYFTKGSFDERTRDLYVVSASSRGEPLGPAELVAALSYAGANDGFLTGSSDGREVFFNSSRPGSVGGSNNLDLWTSTRRNANDAWSAPVNMGSPVNTGAAEIQPDLSADGRALLFAAGPARGGQGRFDIWMATRTR